MKNYSRQTGLNICCCFFLSFSLAILDDAHVTDTSTINFLHSSKIIYSQFKPHTHTHTYEWTVIVTIQKSSSKKRWKFRFKTVLIEDRFRCFNNGNRRSMLHVSKNEWCLHDSEITFHTLIVSIYQTKWDTRHVWNTKFISSAYIFSVNSVDAQFLFPSHSPI